MSPQEKEEILNNPLHRTELYYKGILNGDTSSLPEPIHREEVYLEAIAKNGGGGGPDDPERIINEAVAKAKREIVAEASYDYNTLEKIEGILKGVKTKVDGFTPLTTEEVDNIFEEE